LPRRRKSPIAKKLAAGKVFSKYIVCWKIARETRWRAQLKRSAVARQGRHAVLLVDDDPALGAAIKDHLAENVIEVTQVHDSVVALGVLEVRREIDLLMTAIAMPTGMSCTVALMVRPLVEGVGVVFVTGRPQLLDAAGNLRDKAFVKPVDLAQAIRHRLAG
jgi:DNA-binding NtrC family response regulator